jgi:hypothetical protein
MNISKSACVLTLSILLPFAVLTATSASAEDDQKEGGALKGAAKGAAVGAVLPGVDAKTGAAVGAVSGAVKANKDEDTGANTEEKKE